MPKSVKSKPTKTAKSKEKSPTSTPLVMSGTNNLLYEEFRLIEKNEENVSPLWKSLHLLLFFLAFIFGSFCTFCFHMLMYMFDEKCVLYPKLVSLTSSKRHKKIFEYLPFKSADGQSVAMDYLQTNWSEKSVCYLPTYLPLVSAIFGLVWITMFLMCSTGSRIHTGLQRPWRVMLPVFVFSLLMGSVCLCTTLITHRGLSDFCDKLSDAIGSKTCSYTVNVVTIVYERRISGVYQATMLTIISAWIHSLCWMFSALLVVMRVVLNVDFHLVRVKAELHGDIDVMLQRYEKQIRTVLPEERKQSSTSKKYTNKTWKMEMLYNRTTSTANPESEESTQYSELTEVNTQKDIPEHEKYISDMLYHLVELIDIAMSSRLARKPKPHPKPTSDITPGRSDEYLSVDLDTEEFKEPTTFKSSKEKKKKEQLSKEVKKKTSHRNKKDTGSENTKEAKDKEISKVSSKKSVNVVTQYLMRKSKLKLFKTRESVISKTHEDNLPDSFLRIKPRIAPLTEENNDSPKLHDTKGSINRVIPLPSTLTPEIGTTSSVEIHDKAKDYISDWDIIFSTEDISNFQIKESPYQNIKVKEPQQEMPSISKDILLTKKPVTGSVEKIPQIDTQRSDVEKNSPALTQRKSTKKSDGSDQGSIYLSTTSSELQIEKEIFETDDLIISPDTESEKNIQLTSKTETTDVNKSSSSQYDIIKDNLMQIIPSTADKSERDKTLEMATTDTRGAIVTPEDYITRVSLLQIPPKTTITDENLVKDEYIISPDTGSQTSVESEYADDILARASKSKKKEKMD